MQARLLLSCCAVLPLLAAAPPGPVWPETEPLSSALATGRVQAEEMRGREVFTFDETRIGTLLRALPQAVIRLDPSLGPGPHCLPVGLARLRLASENRLLLDMNDHEFRAALAARRACGT
jgi:hypothetical protein